MPARTSGLVWVAWLLVVASSAPAAQRGTPTPATALPPLSMTCPMHPDVVERAPGTCPLCRMNLVPVRLAAAWTCPVHAVVNEDGPGTCPICGRALVPVTVALTWTCRGEPNPEHLEPGVCADGSPRIGARTLRPHGNHNPRFGGQFFMAPDNWHHLEGTYPRAGLFRLHLFDDFARPLSADKLKAVQARVVTLERFDAASRRTTEITAFPLRLAADGAFEARVDTAAFPAALTAKVRFAPGTPEYRFDFTFTAATAPPGPVAAPRPRAARAATPRRATTAAREPRRTDPEAPAPIAAGTGLPVQLVPTSVRDILAALRAREAEVSRLVDAGDFGAVWVPAFQAKDLAIALEAQLDRLTPEGRRLAEPALQALVRAAWQLDAVGDLGDRQQVEAARAAFAARAGDVERAFAVIP